MHVSEMLNNLIRNTMEAIKEKGKIVLGLHETKRMISITVTDDGPGWNIKQRHAICNGSLLYNKEAVPKLWLGAILLLQHHEAASRRFGTVEYGRQGDGC